MVDRGDVSRMRSRWALATILIASVVWPHAADSDQPCEVVPMPCTFESLPFKFKVVDAETHQPLADVHALAEWQTEEHTSELQSLAYLVCRLLLEKKKKT